MHTHTARRLIRTSTVVLAFTAALSACGTTPTSGSSPSASSSQAAPSGSAAPTTAGPSTPATSVPGPATSGPATTGAGDAVDVTVRLVDGSPEAGVVSVRARQGQTVRLVGTSDTEDSLHVHGYDKTLELHAGQTTTTSFVADVSGSFEIETHESEKLVAQLVVS